MTVARSRPGSRGAVRSADRDPYAARLRTRRSGSGDASPRRDNWPQGQKRGPGLEFIAPQRSACAARDLAWIDVDGAVPELHRRAVETAWRGDAHVRHLAGHVVRERVTGIAEPARAVARNEVRTVRDAAPRTVKNTPRAQSQQLTLVKTNDVKRGSFDVVAERRDRPRGEVVEKTHVDPWIRVWPHEAPDRRDARGGEQRERDEVAATQLPGLRGPQPRARRGAVPRRRAVRPRRARAGATGSHRGPSPGVRDADGAGQASTIGTTESTTPWSRSSAISASEHPISARIESVSCPA